MAGAAVAPVMRAQWPLFLNGVPIYPDNPMPIPEGRYFVPAYSIRIVKSAFFSPPGTSNEEPK